MRWNSTNHSIHNFIFLIATFTTRVYLMYKGQFFSLSPWQSVPKVYILCAARTGPLFKCFLQAGSKYPFPLVRLTLFYFSLGADFFAFYSSSSYFLFCFLIKFARWFETRHSFFKISEYWVVQDIHVTPFHPRLSILLSISFLIILIFCILVFPSTSSSIRQ